MTTAQNIIKKAFRESNLIPVGQSPTSAQETEALEDLNNLLLSVLGYEMGDPLDPLPLGKNNVERPVGYPYNWIESLEWLPRNVRLMCNLESAEEVNLYPDPDDGSRFGVVDVSGNFSGNNLTVNGNGRTIEGNATLTLSTDGLNDEWFYRGDLGDWKKVTNLTVSDDLPYPQEFDDYFVIMLALRLNPRYGRQLDQQTQAYLNRAESRFQARYSPIINVPADSGVLRLSRQSYRRGRYRYGARSPTGRFQSGLP